MEYIKRNFPAEFRADENDTGVITGVPIVFDTPTDIGGYFEEVIEAGAISDEVISAAADVRLFWNHNIDEKALARTVIPFEKNGGLLLTRDKKGVNMKARLNLERSDAKDLYIAIQDETINAMSFMFYVEEEEWERKNTDYPKRIIKKISPVVEVSAVNFAAYPTTSIKSARADISSENDIRILENMRKAQRSGATDKDRLELEKLKAEILYKI